MKSLIVSAVIAAFALSLPIPSLAKTDCRKDIGEFDAAVKVAKASKTNVAKATKLRNEAQKDCLAKGGSASGDADMQRALKLVGAR